MALPSHIINPTYALSLFVYQDLAGNLSHTLNIFIFFCNFLGTCPNLTRERSIPLFRLRLPALQISCLLLWLQRDANILVQALRSIQHTLYSSVFHSRCPSGTHSFSLHFLSFVSTHSPYRFCLAVSQKLSNVSLCAVCSSFSTLSFISVSDFPLFLFLVYLLPGHHLWSSLTVPAKPLWTWAPSQEIYSQSDVSFSPILLPLTRRAASLAASIHCMHFHFHLHLSIFIQSHFHCIQGAHLHFFSSCFPWLSNPWPCVASTMLYLFDLVLSKLLMFDIVITIAADRTKIGMSK